jgi:hypothetical protein
MINTPQKTKVNKYARSENVRSMKYFIVIVVEGDVAEPSYFRMIEEKFKNSIKLKIVPSQKKSSPKNLLETARKERREYSDSGSEKKPESIWIVCDVDLHKNFHPIIKEAQDEGFKVAISNPCFEVWLFQHLAEIKIEKGLTIFCKDDQILLEIDNSKKPTKDLSQKVKKILDEVRPKKGPQKYEAVYFDKIDDAVKKAQKNLKDVQKKDFLLESKHIGQTRVGQLISEIKNI